MNKLDKHFFASKKTQKAFFKSKIEKTQWEKE